LKVAGDKWPIVGSNAVRNGCPNKTEVTLWEANNTCTSTPGYNSLVTAAWGHENNHSIRAFQGAASVSDVYAIADDAVFNSENEVRNRVTQAIEAMNAAAFTETYKLDNNPTMSPSYLVWYLDPNDFWTWDLRYLRTRR
jgi:hypothetical protein